MNKVQRRQKKLEKKRLARKSRAKSLIKKTHYHASSKPIAPPKNAKSDRKIAKLLHGRSVDGSHIPAEDLMGITISHKTPHDTTGPIPRIEPEIETGINKVCPKCDAIVGSDCITPSGKWARKMHKARI